MGIGNESAPNRRYNWHSAGSLGWPFPMLKYKDIFQIEYTEAISIIFGTLSFPMVYAEMNLLAEICRVASGDDCKVRRSRQ